MPWIWAWIERPPSLQGMEKYIWSGCPLWAVMGEVRRVGRERNSQAITLDEWMLPNKLPCREVRDEK
ncbi:plasmid SOS inhibition protein A [Enterobacter asburiae]